MFTYAHKEAFPVALLDMVRHKLASLAHRCFEEGSHLVSESNLVSWDELIQSKGQGPTGQS